MNENTDSFISSRWAVIIVILVTGPVLQVVYSLYFNPLAKIPGPRLWAASRIPFVKALLSGTIVQDFEKLHRRYGPVVRVAPDEVSFAAAEAWNDILQTKPDHGQFLKDPDWWGAQPGMPDAILSAIRPEPHARIRKILTPGFTPRALKSQEPILHRYANLFIDRLREIVSDSPEEQGEVDIMPWFNFLAFDIFGDLGFGESFDCLQHSRYHPWIALLFDSVRAATYVAAFRLFYPALAWWLVNGIPPLKKMQMDHHQQIVDKISRRFNFELQRPDIMSHVIEANEDNTMSRGSIDTTFMMLTTAGSETTATALAGTTNHLVNNPDKLAILTKEIRGAFRAESEFTLEALRKLPYLNAVLHEGLRLCPPIPWILPRRVPAGGDTVCGRWLPGGTRVSIQAYTMNRDPAYFHQATAFVPERWFPEANIDPKSPFFGDRRQALQTFSLGPRSCMGQNLAWAEMRLALAKILWTFDMEAVDGKKVRWEDLRTFLLVEKKPIYVRMRLRADGL